MHSSFRLKRMEELAHERNENNLTISVKTSTQAMRIRSTVKGLFSVKSRGSALSFRAAATASRIAKNTELPRKNPASPMP